MRSSGFTAGKRAMLAVLLLGGLTTPLQARQPTDTTFAVEPGGQLSIDNHRGAVRILSWDRAAMRVVASHFPRIHIEIDRSATGVELEAESRRGAPYGIDYDITVPRKYSIGIDCDECSVLVQDVDGDIDVDNTRGDIVLRGGSGRREIDSFNGEIIVTGARGHVFAKTDNGSIRLSDITGDVSAESVSGEIQLTGIAADNVDAETVNGPVQYEGSLRNGGQYSLSTHYGSIRVTIPEDAGVDVNVSTLNGGVEADFPFQVRGALQHGEVSFVIGNGGARLDLESFNGTVQLVRPR